LKINEFFLLVPEVRFGTIVRFGSVFAASSVVHHGHPGQETAMNEHPTTAARSLWNKGKLTGQKAPLRLNEIYAIRVRLQLAHRIRDLALFNLAIDSKLRGCDLVKLRVQDVTHGTQVANRAVVMQQKTKRPVWTAQSFIDTHRPLCA